LIFGPKETYWARRLLLIYHSHRDTMMAAVAYHRTARGIS